MLKIEKLAQHTQPGLGFSSGIQKISQDINIRESHALFMSEPRQKTKVTQYPLILDDRCD